MSTCDGVHDLKIPTVNSKVFVDVIIGQAQHGQYTVKLFDSQGYNPKEVGSGNNYDTLPDTFELDNSAPGLAGRLLGWTITIASPQAPNGQMYYARVIVREGTMSLSAEPIECSGPLDGAKIFIGYGKFCVA